MTKMEWLFIACTIGNLIWSSGLFYFGGMGLIRNDEEIIDEMGKLHERIDTLESTCYPFVAGAMTLNEPHEATPGRP